MNQDILRHLDRHRAYRPWVYHLLDLLDNLLIGRYIAYAQPGQTIGLCKRTDEDNVGVALHITQRKRRLCRKGRIGLIYDEEDLRVSTDQLQQLSPGAKVSRRAIRRADPAKLLTLELYLLRLYILRNIG